MAHTTSPRALVAMPGTGSDADYVMRAFGSAATTLGVELVALEPTTDLAGGYLAALDAAAAHYGPILVGGVSIGASIVTSWALRNAATCAGVLAALPPWSGPPAGSIASVSAAATAAAMRADGLEATIATMTAGSPEWLSAELTRSWRRLYPDLLAQLDAAASFVGPTLAELGTLAVPLAITASTDDLIHPIDVARQWAAAAPRSVLYELPLHTWGVDAALLGDTCARGWLELTGTTASGS
ncbi:alpha/beta hydrolase [Gordonia sp. TBRC 11910]|uniref:Alpha/beta hydrolase n=1 Tax=Gordonia asplenii TaxID=2725283 RepID=A0A848KUU1_9ACTN|nr:alpha/beta hydrolase [Gordonia asplenii]NMN99950.1 alpha/beta hydrolase [Gordonia asplenii]